VHSLNLPRIPTFLTGLAIELKFQPIYKAVNLHRYGVVITVLSYLDAPGSNAYFL